MNDNTILKNVYDTIEKYKLFKKGDSVVVGLSGGPDSVCLLHVLLSLSAELDLKLTAVHINHMLRGEESDRDEEYARLLCLKFGIRLYIKRINIIEISEQRGLSVEEAGREARYEQFELVAGEVGATKIAVAHNKNDQAETLLMRLIRGTGLEGLKGIGHKRGKVVRPLLDLSRREIEDYCNTFNLEPRTDSSNLESIYTRNKIRLDLIPQINRLFDTDIVETLFRTANLFKEDNEYIEESAAIIYNQCIIDRNDKEIRLDISKILNCHRAIAKRLVRLAVKHVKGDIKGIESIHADMVLDLAIKGKTGSQVHLPFGVRALVSYGILSIRVIEEGDQQYHFEKAVSIPGTTFVEELGIQLDSEIIKPEDAKQNLNEKSFIQIFDFEKLSEGINIRNRRNGDVFRPFRSNGTKKLKEYFIDNKIPRDDRDKIILIAKGKEIVWIVGNKISDKFTVTENTKSVLKLTFIKC